MKLQKLCKRAKAMWYVRNGIVFLVMTCATLIAVLASGFSPISAVAGVFWLILAVLLFVWPALSYKNYTYGYDGKRFYIAYGVIFKHEITAPLCQIQDLHFYEGPIMQLFQLGKVIFATGGSNFELIGLDKEDAHALIEEVEGLLRARIEENADEEV